MRVKEKRPNEDEKARLPENLGAVYSVKKRHGDPAGSQALTEGQRTQEEGLRKACFPLSPSLPLPLSLPTCTYVHTYICLHIYLFSSETSKVQILEAF